MKALKVLLCGVAVGLSVYAVVFIPAPMGGLAAALLAGGGVLGFANTIKDL